jgi:hypothetical protein
MTFSTTGYLYPVSVRVKTRSYLGSPKVVLPCLDTSGDTL